MRTVLFEKHLALGAKMVDFCGWEMPVQYKGIIPEHKAVREHVGIFDVSHMGRVSVVGTDAERFLDFLSTNLIEGKPNLSATYTVWCNEDGGCVDDVIVFKESVTQYFVIVNAGNRQKDLQHMQRWAANFSIEITDHYQQDGILAIQGPAAYETIGTLFPESKSIKPMHFAPLQFQGRPLVLSHSGYTGAGGFEIYTNNELIEILWDTFINMAVEPIGLGARDTLRLEKGYALYGHELKETIFPNETVAAWTVKWTKKDFLGKKALVKVENSPTKRTEYGVELIDPGVAREGYDVFKDGGKIGNVTSGTHSPSLHKSIAIILVQKQLHYGDVVDIKIRQQQVRAKVTPLPFL